MVIDNVSCFDTLQHGLNALSNWASAWQLCVSIKKCCTLHIGARNLRHEYTINSSLLPSVTSYNDLGVLIDCNLRFIDHYACIVAKAHQRAALILRCFKSRDSNILFRAFIVYVRPLLENCSPVWCPVYRTDVDLLEKVQRRFTKRLTGLRNLSYSERLCYLKTETLESRRLKMDLTMIFKILHNYVDVTIADFFTLSDTVQTRGHSLKLYKPKCNLNVRTFSFACRRIDCWNSLSNNCVTASSVAIFKKYLNIINFDKFLLYSGCF